METYDATTDNFIDAFFVIFPVSIHLRLAYIPKT